MIIAVAGQKGGSGKTTTAICLGDEFFVRGAKVLLVDADPQQSLATWASVAAEEGLEVPTVVAMGDTMHRPDQLPKLAEHFDVVIIDCPPASNNIQKSALMVADVAVLPCGPSSMEVNALGESVDLVLRAQYVRPDLKAALLITRSDHRTVLSRVMRERIADLDLPVFDQTIPMRVGYQHLPDAGVGMTRYQPDSTAAAEIRTLVDELIAWMEEDHAVEAA